MFIRPVKKELGNYVRGVQLLLGILCGLEGAGKHAGYLIGCDPTVFDHSSGMGTSDPDHLFFRLGIFI